MEQGTGDVTCKFIRLNLPELAVINPKRSYLLRVPD
jgi:hypothetical protein